MKGKTFAIAMSGFGLREIRERSIKAGFRHHLLKPITPEKVDQILEEAETELAKD